MQFKHELYILVGTGIVVLLVYLVSGLNIDVKISGKSSQAAVLGSSKTTLSKAPQVDSMADHHGRGKSADSTVFDGLLGKPAPDFTLEAYDGTRYSLSSLKGKNVLLFFNEGLMCYPACWNQVAAFGTDTEFDKKNTIVLSINVDPKPDWKKAIDKMPELSKATVLLDSNRSVSSTYGVLTLPSSMHRGQYPGHSYVIIDKDGIVRFARDDEQMAVRNKELLAEIDKL